MIPAALKQLGLLDAASAAHAVQIHPCQQLPRAHALETDGQLRRSTGTGAGTGRRACRGRGGGRGGGGSARSLRAACAVCCVALRALRAQRLALVDGAAHLLPRARVEARHLARVQPLEVLRAVLGRAAQLLLPLLVLVLELPLLLPLPLLFRLLA